MESYGHVTKNPNEIWEQVRDELGFSKQQLLGNQREFTKGRKRWAEIAYESLYTLSAIGRHLKRDHTTVMYYLNRRKDQKNHVS